MTEQASLNTAGLDPIEIQAQKCFLVAFKHHETADHLWGDVVARPAFRPSVVIIRAFSVELIIKAGLIAERGACPKLHDLSRLFKELGDSSRSFAKHHFDMNSGGGLETFLATESDTFVDWRYLHEETRLISQPEKLRGTFLAVYSAIADYPAFINANPYPP